LGGDKRQPKWKNSFEFFASFENDFNEWIAEGSKVIETKAVSRSGTRNLKWPEMTWT